MKIVFFNVGIKMITILHEFIIHLFFGYLNFISDRELPSSSPKKGNNIVMKMMDYYLKIFYSEKYMELYM